MTKHYLKCASERCTGTHFSVVVDEEGNLDRYECAECGGYETEEGMEALDR